MTFLSRFRRAIPLMITGPVVAALAVASVSAGTELATAAHGLARAARPPAAPRVLSMGNLPTGKDLEFQRAGDWRVASTSATLGKRGISDRFAGRRVDALGATTSNRRNYRLVNGAAGERASAVSLEFRTPTAARSADKAIRGWVLSCPATLRRLGYAEGSVDAFTPVKLQIGRAAHTVVTHTIKSQPQSELRVFEEFGLARVKNRLTVVVMSTRGQDYNWSAVYNPELLQIYPMIRSLGKVGHRLAKNVTRVRHLSDRQLITVRQVPDADGRSVVTTKPGIGRTVDALSVCQTQGLAALHAQQVRSRNFAYGRGASPTVYTAALQFTNERAASRAYMRYLKLLAACPAALTKRGYGVYGMIGRVAAPTRFGRGNFREIHYLRPEQANADTGYFESVGLTQVRDRMMITVSLVHGQDYNVSLNPRGDSATGIPPHPQFALVKAAGNRLSR